MKVVMSAGGGEENVIVDLFLYAFYFYLKRVYE